MIRATLEVTNRLGLHARAAARLVRLASSFHSVILLGRDGADLTVDSKSILGILMLAARSGTRIELAVDGEDEQEAEAAIRRLFADGFGEIE